MPSAAPYDPTGVEYYTIPSFTFTNGTTLPIRVAYRSFNPTAPNTILIPTCFGGHINTTLNFTRTCLSSYHVVAAAMLGNGESSSPSNTPSLPQPTYTDCVRAHHALLTAHLRIPRLTAVIGFSMGGQQAYHWAALYPSYLTAGVVAICTSARTSPHNWAFLEGPTAALRASIDYADGGFRAAGVVPVRGLHAFGRAYCAWAYSAAWFRARVWESALGFASVDAFMQAQWEAPYEKWDPDDLLALARMWQAGDLGTTLGEGMQGDYTTALEAIEVPVLVMPCRTDQYFRPEDSEVEMKYLKKGTLAVIESVWGHVAGGGGRILRMWSG